MEDIPGGLSYEGSACMLNSSPLRSGMTTPNANSSPSARAFNFTPTRGRIYPILDVQAATTSYVKSSPVQQDQHMADESYLGKDHSSSFINKMDSLVDGFYSANITNKVMSDLGSRYLKVRDEKISLLEQMNSNTTNDELNRRASGRFSREHRSRFSKMESIQTHYAARRSEAAAAAVRSSPKSRKVVQSDDCSEKENLSAYDKRLQQQLLESASKRMKLLDGNFKENSSSPTKPAETKRSLLNYYKSKVEHIEPMEEKSIPVIKPLPPPVLEKKPKPIPNYLKPTRSSSQRSISQQELPNSKSMPAVRVKTEPSSHHINPSASQLYMNGKQGLKKSPTKSSLSSFVGNSNMQLQNTTLSPPRLSPSKISPSKGVSNLNSILQNSEARQHQSFSTSTPVSSSISRSKTTGNVTGNSRIPVSISTKTSLLSNSVNRSSSIPRLINAELVPDNLKKKSWKY